MRVSAEAQLEILEALQWRHEAARGQGLAGIAGLPIAVALLGLSGAFDPGILIAVGAASAFASAVVAVVAHLNVRHVARLAAAARLEAYGPFKG